MLPLDVCRVLAQHEHAMIVTEGTLLIEHGVLPDSLVIVNSGTVRVSVPCSGRVASVTSAEPGRVFGMRAVISGEPPEIDVACVDACRVTFVPREIFISCLETHPEIYFAVAKVLSRDLQIANRILRISTRGRRTPSASRVLRTV